MDLLSICLRKIRKIWSSGGFCKEFLGISLGGIAKIVASGRFGKDFSEIRVASSADLCRLSGNLLSRTWDRSPADQRTLSIIGAFIINCSQLIEGGGVML